MGDSWSATKSGSFRGGSFVAPERTAETREPWMDEALCAQIDTEMFFPEKGGSTRDAKRVCVTCDVKAQCLEYALRNDERFGIWGGLSERERRKYRRGVPVPLMRDRSLAGAAPAPVVPFEDRPVSPNTSWTHGQNARMKQLVIEGASDRQIAKAMRVEVHTIYYRRVRAGLLANIEAPITKVKPPRRPYRSWTEDELATVRRLHGEGMSDTAIADVVGHRQADVSKKRAKMGLAPHYRWAEGGRR